MNVKIFMDRAPTAHNRKLLSFLLKNVIEYRSTLRMKIITISKKNRETIDANITELPSAYVGTNIVAGCKNIMSAIEMAYNQAKMQISSDPVQTYWDRNIKDGLGEVKRERKNNENDLEVRFTEVSRQRKKLYENKSHRFKNKQQPNDDDDDKPVQQMSSAKFKAPQTTAEMALQNSGDNVTRVGDYDDPTSLETDPHMKMFWSNQTITPGT